MRRESVILLLVVAMLFSIFGMSAGVGDGFLSRKAWAEPKKLPPERKVRQIELYVTTPDYCPIRYEFGLLIAQNWRKLGFDVKVTPLAFSKLVHEGLRQHNYDVFTLAWGGRAVRIDPDHFCYTILHSSQVAVRKFNLNGYQNPEYDKWAELQRFTVDPQKRRKAVFKCQEIFAKDQPHTPIVSRNRLHPYNDRDWTGWTSMMGEGLVAFWNFMNVKPKAKRKLLYWGFPSDVSSLNPLAAVRGSDFHVFRLIYDRLVRINTKGVPEKWAAEEIREINNTTFDVKIRSGMKFHDGKPVTVEDVKFSFEYPSKVQSGYFMGLLKPIAGIEIVDSQTLRFRLKKPFAPFIANCLGQVFILPKHIWEGIPESVGLKSAMDYTNEKPIGSGPLKLIYWRRNEELKLGRFEDYFHPVHFDSVLRIAYASLEGVVAGIATGECDFLGGGFIAPSQAARLSKVGHIKVLRVREHGYYHINYNMRRKPFDDVAVRRAMAYGIPKKLILDRLLEGYGEVVHSNICPANEFWHNPNVEEFYLDLERARKTLADAGYEWDDEGHIYYPEGKKAD